MPSLRVGGTNETEETYGDGTRNYTLLGTWEALRDVDLVAITTSYGLRCFPDSASYDDSISMASAVCDATYYRRIFSDDPSTKAVFNCTGAVSYVFSMWETFSQLHDLSIIYSGASSASCIRLGKHNQTIVGCNAKSEKTTTIHVSGTMNDLRINCCNVYSGASHGIDAGTGANTVVENCTVIGCAQRGFVFRAATQISRNNLASGNVVSGFLDLESADRDYEASSDTTAAGANSHVSQVFDFVDADNDDYQLKRTDPNAARGTDLSATFNDLHNGNLVDALGWPIGAGYPEAPSVSGSGRTNMGTFHGIHLPDGSHLGR